jgi:hypothetical protein
MRLSRLPPSSCDVSGRWLHGAEIDFELLSAVTAAINEASDAAKPPRSAPHSAACIHPMRDNVVPRRHRPPPDGVVGFPGQCGRFVAVMACHGVGVGSVVGRRCRVSGCPGRKRVWVGRLAGANGRCYPPSQLARRSVTTPWHAQGRGATAAVPREPSTSWAVGPSRFAVVRGPGQGCRG